MSDKKKAFRSILKMCGASVVDHYRGVWFTTNDLTIVECHSIGAHSFIAVNQFGKVLFTVPFFA